MKDGQRRSSLEDIQSLDQNISQDFRKLEGQSTNRFGLVTAYGRQLSTNEELQLKLATDSKNSSPLVFQRGDNKKITFIEGSEKKSGMAFGQGLRAQNTIPLNFFDDMKIGYGIDETKYVNGETQDQPGKWFQDENFSVIYKKPTTVDKNAFNEDNFSLPSYSDRSRQSKNMKKARIEFPDFDENEAQSPLGNVYFNLDDEDNGFESKKSNDGYTEQKDRETNLNIETGIEAAGIQSTNINFDYYTKNIDSEADFLKPQNTQKIKRLQDVNLNKSSQYMKKLELNFQANMENSYKWNNFDLPDNENDISEIEKNFEIDFAQKLSLDERRAKMYIINNLLAATNQGQVKDDSFFMIVDKDSLERIDDMRGRCLLPRRTVMKVKTHVTHLAGFIISSKVFDAVTLTVIVLNSVQLATNDPTSSTQPYFFSVLDNVFMGFYTTEMTLKIIGMGFVLNKGSYLRDPWNVLDFVIVSTGLLQLMLSGSKLNLSGLRSFRVLRPLKTITNIEGLKVIVVAILSSISQLRDSFIVLYFFYLIFAIAGLQFFSGVFKNQCVDIETGVVDPSGNVCGIRSCDNGQFCGKTNSNPYYEQSNFDTIFYAFITVFQCVTLESWTYVMKFAQKTYAQQSWFFFCPLTFIISYFLLQFTQAVISNAFAKQHESKGEGKVVKKKKRKALKDFDNLDDKEKEKLLKSQEEARKQVLYKWRMIFFIKKEMRILVKKHLERKRTERQAKLMASGASKANVNIGFKNFITHKFPKEGNRDTMMEESASARFLLNERTGKETSNRIFDNQQIISVEDEFESKKTFHTFRKPSLLIAKSKNFNKIANSEIFDYDKVGQSSKALVKNLGIHGIKEMRLNPQDTGIDVKQQDGNFFDQFVNEEINFLEQNFSEEQLRQMVLNLDGEQFLQDMENNPQDMDYGDLSQLSIEYDRKIKEQRVMNHEGQEWESNIVSDMDSVYEGKDQTQLFSQTIPNQIVLDNQTIIKQDSTLADQKQSESDNKESTVSLPNKVVTQQSFKPQVRKYKSKQAIGASIERFQNEGKDLQKAKTEPELKKSDTQKTNDVLTKANPMKKLKPLKFKSRFDGPNTIKQRDLVSYEHSIFNNKSLVEDEVGKHKKIYIRKDKLDFHKQITDIFEVREKLKKDIQFEQAQKESVDYLSIIQIKPYCRKVLLDPKPIALNEDQQEILQSMQLEASDLEKEIQRQFSKQFISELYVTGTLSITIGKKREEKKAVLRKIQGQGIQQEESENAVMIQMVKQQLTFMNLSCSMGSLAFPSDKSSQNATSMMESSLGSKSQVSKSGINTMSTLKSKKTMIGGPKRQGKASGLAVNEVNENSANARKERFLIKQAARDANFQKKLIIKRINKDAIRSRLFKESVIKRKGILNRSGDDIKDSDDEDEKDKEEDDEDNINDDYLDLEFDNAIEILRSKKSSLQVKVQKVQWSGQDVLENYDPKEARIARQTLQKIRIWRKGGLGYWKRLQWTFKAFITSGVIDYFLTFCVCFNTVCLALDRYGIDPITESFLTWANKIFTFIFISEMGCKLIGLGPLRYLKDKMHYLDGTIVLLSIVELVLEGGGGAISAFRSIRIFRIFRVLRLTRLLKSMKTMSVILNALVNSLSSLMYLYLLVFLSIFIFTLLGMQLFGGKLNYADNADGYPGVPRQNYDTFQWSFETCFQLLTQENWPTILYDTLRSPVNRLITMLYHIAWMTVGNTILLNLLMGIMLDSMKEEEDIERDFENMKKKHVEDMRRKEGQVLIDHFLVNQIQLTKKSSMLGKKKKKKQKKDDNVLEESFEFDPDIFTQKVNFNFSKKKKKDFEGNYCELSFYIFTKRNPLRHALYKMSHHFMFEVFIQCVILFSSVKLILDSYTKNLATNSPLMIWSGYLDYFFTATFAMESLIKSLSLGFVMDKGTYLRETWSQLDFFIVVTALIDASFSSVNIPFIKVLRLLRTLRPLRVISHNSEMKTVIVALIHSVSGIMYVGVLLMLVWVMFAILGVTLIGGKMYSCTIDPYVYFTEAECAQAEGVWENFPFNYDNVGIALVSLFDVATMENWPDQRNAAMDASGQGTGPIRDHSMYYGWYFDIFILIGTYIFLNLFIGVIFIKFGDAQQEEIESTHLNVDQLKWVDMVKMIVNAKPDLETTNIPLDPYRKKIHELVTGAPYYKKPDQDKNINKFEMTIMACIMLNMFSMCMTYEGESTTVVEVTTYINYFFTAVFIFEATCKLIAFDVTYFQSSWNLFDFFVVSASILDIMLSQLNLKTSSFLKIGPQLARIMRVLRISRLFRLIKKYKGLNALMQTIQFSMPALMNVFALLMLVYFIFAILACFMFGDVTTGMIIDPYTNFNTFGTSMLTLIRASTGEDWNYIMYDCGHTQFDGCIPGYTCGSAYNQVFFLCFETIQTFIMLNLFVLVTIQQFEKYYLQANNVLQHFKDNLALFKDMWTYFTIQDKCEKIKGQNVVRFFYDIGLLIKLKQYKNNTLVTYFHEVSNRQINKPDDYFKLKERKEEKRKAEEQKKLRLDDVKGVEKEDEKDAKKKPMDSNAIDQITKDVVRMDLEADGEGYVYFNELLFKTMKMVFGEQHLKNTILVDAEYKALKKIQQIKEKVLKKQRATARIQAMTVNPFVLKMFKHISFKSWLKAYKQNLEKRAKQKEEKGEVEVSDAEIDEVVYKKTPGSQVDLDSDEEYFYETEKDESCDEEESEAKASSQGVILDSEDNNGSESQISGSRNESDISSSDLPQKSFNDQA